MLAFTRARLWIASAVLCAGCATDAPASSASSGAPSVVSSSSAPAAATAATSTTTALASAKPACELPSEGACLDASTRRVCDASGAVVEERCSAGASCLASRCEALRDVDGAAVDPKRVRIPSREGFFNAFSMYKGVPSKLAKDLRETGDLAHAIGELRGRKPQAMCAPSGFVQPSVKGSESGGAAVLASTIWSDRQRHLELRASVRGKVTFWIGARSFTLDELPGSEGNPEPDEQFIDLDLPAGATALTAIVEPESGGFYLRARENGWPPMGLALAERFEAAACKPAALLDAGVDLALTADGLRLTARPRFHGALPQILSSSSSIEIAFDVGVTHARETKSAGTLRFDAARLLEDRAGDASAAVAWPGAASEIAVSGLDATLWKRKLYASEKLVARAAELERALPAVRGDTRIPSGSRASFEAHVELVAELVAGGDPEVAWVDELTTEAEAMHDAAARGEDPYAKKRGFVRRAYRSPLDGNLSRYVAFVPPKRREPQPLVAIAHGRDRLAEHALRTLVGEAPDEHMTLTFAARHMPAFRDQGAILVAPSAFGNAGVLPVGEEDTLAVLEEMKRAYDVDARRVSLTGYSLGGTVSFVLPLHYPDLFASTAPLCGYPNLMDYVSVSRVPHQTWEDALLAKEFIGKYVENGMYVPIHVVHGGLDAPERSKVVVDRYKRLGYPYRFDVQDDLGHDVWTYAYKEGRMVSWLTSKTSPRAPKRVRLVTGKYRYDRAYWVRLVRMVDASLADPAEIDARWDPKKAKLELSTKNVALVELDLGALDPKPSSAGIDVVVDERAPLHLESAERVVLSVAPDSPVALATDDPTATDVKRHGLSGPLDDALHVPLTIVFGTGDPAMREANELVARHLANLGGAATIQYPVLADTDATDAALDGRSVVLIGGPRDNALTRAIAGALPATFEADAITLRGERYAGPDVAVSFIFPGPAGFTGEATQRRAPGRYVVVHAGLSPRAILAARSLPRYLPDFVVYDAGLARRVGGLLMAERAPLAAGFFTESWQ
ncbi:MAG: hypothetical protein U0271_23160 [Polyangiaceae bacterium]